MSFHPARSWNLIKNATTEEEVWDILERKDLPSKEANQVVNMFRISQKVKTRSY